MGLVAAIGPSSFAEENDAPLRMLAAAGVTVKPNPYGRRLNETEIIAHIAGADGLLAGLEPISRGVLASAQGRLRAVARVGIGMENVDRTAAEEFGIKISNTPDGPTQAVAEATVAALLCIARRLRSMDAALHKGNWSKEIGFGLLGAKVLFIGYGRIGRRTGALLHAFGAELLVNDPAAGVADMLHGERLVSLGEGLAVADVISLHASGAACLLGPDEFALMKRGAIVLNSARGELIDEDALCAALATGQVSGAWIDAFWREPYTGPLTEYPQALLTPHTATYTRQCRLAMETQAVKNLLRDLGVSA